MAMHSTPSVMVTKSYHTYLVIKKYIISHFRMFALKCAACQMPIASQPVSCSVVLADVYLSPTLICSN